MRKRIISLFLVVGILLTNCSSTIYAESMTNQNTITFVEKESFEKNVTTYADISVLENELNIFLSKNPNASVNEQEDYLRTIASNDELFTSRKDGVGDYVPGYNDLNSEERKLAKKHPVQAIRVYECAQSAMDYTESYYGASQWQDNSDAFRHCIWNAFMKKAIGSKATKKWATAHEYTSSGIDKKMDLHNNSIGRSIEVEGVSRKKIGKKVKSAIVKGKCKRIVNNKLVKTDKTGLIK